MVQLAAAAAALTTLGGGGGGSGGGEEGRIRGSPAMQGQMGGMVTASFDDL